MLGCHRTILWAECSPQLGHRFSPLKDFFQYPPRIESINNRSGLQEVVHHSITTLPAGYLALGLGALRTLALSGEDEGRGRGAFRYAGTRVARDTEDLPLIVYLEVVTWNRHCRCSLKGFGFLFLNIVSS